MGKDTEKERRRPHGILLRSDFYSKPRNRKFISNWGAEGLLLIQLIWMLISQERNFRLPANLTKLETINFPVLNDFSPTQNWADEVFFAAVEVGLLEFDGENYLNSQVTKDSKKLMSYHFSPLGEKSAKNINRASLKDPILLRSSLKQEEDPSRILIRTNLEEIEDLNKEKKAKNTGGEKSITNGEKSRGRPANILPELPNELNSPANIRAWEWFLRYRRCEKRKSVTPSTAELIFKNYILTPDEFAADIEETISNGWIGLRRLFDKNANGEKSKSQTAKNKSGAAKNTVDRNIELLFGDGEK